MPDPPWRLCQIVADLGSGLSAIHGNMFVGWRNVFQVRLSGAEEFNGLYGGMVVRIVAGRLETKISRP